MRVSVVIPTYNREASIAAAILSVAHQTEPPEEIIVVDDGSTDNTRAVIERLNLPNLVYLYQDNLGGNVARNRGIEIAKAPWIAFQDSDDYWLPHKLATLRQEMTRRNMPSIEVAFSSFALFDPAKRRIRIMPKALADVRENSVIYDEPIKQTNTLVANPISTQTLVASKDILERVGRFDVSLSRFQDWDLAIRLAATSSLLYVSEPLCYVAISSDSVTRKYQAGIAARRHLLTKHAALYDAYPAARRRALIDLRLRELFSWARK